MQSDHSEIVVGVDGSSAGDAALRYALEVGRSQQVPVRLVHAVPVIGTMPPVGMIDPDRTIGVGRDLVLDLVRRAELAAPSVDVRTTLQAGSVASVLVAASRDASLVVLGRPAGRQTLPLVTGSKAAAVTKRSRSPVRVIPGDWRPGVAGKDVVVGLKDPTPPSALLVRGFAEAARSGGVLVMLHAWRLPAGYEDLMSDAEASSWSEQLHQRIVESTGQVRSRFPDVPLQVRVLQDHPVRALGRACEGAGLLVLGRHARTAPWIHLGSIPRALQRTAACPVEVLPITAEPPPELDLELERNGTILR